jgi:hypothetical protein
VAVRIDQHGGYRTLVPGAGGSPSNDSS